MARGKFMFRIRDNRDVRGHRCGLIKGQGIESNIMLQVDPATVVKLHDPELAERLAARLRGEHVDLFPVKGAGDK